MVLWCASGCATSSDESEEGEKEELPEQVTGGAASKIETVSTRESRNDRERIRVEDVVEEYSGKFQACYERGLLVSDSKALSGELTFAWTVDREGAIHNVRLAEDSLHRDDIADCVQSIVERMTFPKPESDSLDVQYPFDFDPGDAIDDEDWYGNVHERFRKQWESPEEVEEEQLRELAGETIVFVELTEAGEVESFEFLRRPGDDDFESTVKKTIEAFQPDAEATFPMPSGSDLRAEVVQTGMILQDWLAKRDEEEDQENASEQ